MQLNKVKSTIGGPFLNTDPRAMPTAVPSNPTNAPAAVAFARSFSGNHLFEIARMEHATMGRDPAPTRWPKRTTWKLVKARYLIHCESIKPKFPIITETNPTLSTTYPPIGYVNKMKIPPITPRKSIPSVGKLTSFVTL